MSYFRKILTRMTRTSKTACLGVRRPVCLAAMSLTLASGSIAQSIASDVGASERINVAGQLGTLSQRIIASACNVNSGITVRESQAVLQISADQFGRISDALLNGNRSFGILGEETRARTLRVISRLNEAWEPLIAQARQTEIAANSTPYILEMAEQSDPLLETANILVSEITGQYADPVALLHADALLIDLAGRQRLLAAQMSKDICLIASGVRVDQAKTDLATSAALFGDTLSALRNGLPTVGVRPPPTEKIAAGLQYVVEEWDTVQPFIAQALAGEPLDTAARQRIYFAFLGIESRMNNVAVSYDQNSKLGL